MTDIPPHIAVKIEAVARQIKARAVAMEAIPDNPQANALGRKVAAEAECLIAAFEAASEVAAPPQLRVIDGGLS